MPKTPTEGSVLTGDIGAYEAAKQKNSTRSISCTIETEGPSDIFSSEIKDREGAATCHRVSYRCERITGGDASSGELPNFGPIECYDITVEMEYGSWATGLQDKLHGGTIIEKITIRRSMNIKNKLVDIQVTTYEVCTIKSYYQVGDTIVFSFKAVRRVDANVAHNLDGTKLGQSVVIYDSATGEATSET
ncbi:MAG: hypothetical protein LBT63_01980 [Holosporaceae bacterium]|jgi:hypothetical protein|nr:hypothetical protein [Holosporaceae bacterium]